MGALAGAWNPRTEGALADVRRLLAAQRWRGAGGDHARAGAGGALGAAWSGESPAPVVVDPSGRWTVAVDGAPTNLRALRDELRARGHLGDDGSPAAVVAALLAELGFERGLERLEGEVAVAALDREGPVAWLAAGRGGLARVAWTSTASGTAWATSAAALRRLEGADPTIEPRLAPVGLRLGFLPAPLTPWRAVRALPAGHLLRVDADGPRVRPGPALAVNPAGAGGAPARWARSIRYAVELAVVQRGEGGPALALGDGGGDAAIGVAGPRRDDALRLRLATEAGPGEPVELDAEAALVLLDELAATTGEPVLDAATLRWAALARAAWDRGAESLLAGVGAAALFGAHPASRLRRAWGRLAPERLAFQRRRAAGPRYVGGDGRGVVDRPPLPETDDALAWAEVDARAAACPVDDDERRAAWLARTLLLPDRDLGPAGLAAAAFGVELRAPYGDPRLVALCAEVPFEHFRRGGDPYALLHAAFPECPGGAPPSLPVAAWLRGALARELDALPEAAAPFVDPAAPRRWIERLRAGDDSPAPALWTLLSLARWYPSSG